MSDLRARHDHVVVLRSDLARASRALLTSWRDAGSAQFDREILQPLDQEADRLARAIADTDARVDLALRAVRRAMDM